MTSTSPRAYVAPRLVRYRPPETRIEEYPVATGAVPSVKCSDAAACVCRGRFCSPPPWGEFE